MTAQKIYQYEIDQTVFVVLSNLSQSDQVLHILACDAYVHVDHFAEDTLF